MEAKRYHVSIKGSEIIGLCPKDTLLQTIKYYDSVSSIPYDPNMSYEQIILKLNTYIQLRDFNETKIIEANL